MKETTKGSKQTSVWDCSLRKKLFFNITPIIQQRPSSIGDPEPVHDLAWDISSNTLAWKKPDGDIDSYHIKVTKAVDIKTFQQTSCRHKVHSIEKGEPYVFSVIAVRNEKTSKAVSKTVILEPEKPTLSYDISNTAVVLHSTCNGSKDCYEVLYKCRGDQMYHTLYFASETKRKPEKMELLEWQPGRVYDVVVKSISCFQTDLEVRSEPAKLTIYSVPSKPKVRCEASATELKLSWDRITEPGVDKITVTYWQGRDGSACTQRLDIDDVSVTTANINNLQPDTQYQADVLFHCGDKLSRSDLIDVMTDIPCPENFRVINSELHSVHLQWNVPPSIATGSWLYLVKYRCFGSSEEYENDQEVTAQSLVVTGLVSGRKYEFSVQVTGWRDAVGQITGKEGKEAFCTGATEPKKPSIKCDLSSKTLALHSTCNGRKDCYEVRYKCREDEVYTTRYYESKTKLSTQRMDLLEWQPGRVYDVEVKSISYFRTNLEVRSEPVKLTIHTVPSKPTVRYEASATDLTVKWVKVNEPGVDKITIEYWLQGDSTKSLSDITDVSATTASIHNLRPGTSYTVQVTYHCGDKSSTSGPIDITTELLPPTAIYHTSVSFSTANIEWDEPNGQYDRMVVTITNLTTKEKHEKRIKRFSTNYTRLRPATCYRVSVKTVKGTQKSAVTSYDFNTAPLPPTGVFVNPGANTANISWTYPDKLENSGISFDIRYWEINAPRSEPFSMEFSKTLQTTIKSLTPGSQYKVQVRAVFQETRNDDFQEATFCTEPPAVSNVQVEGYSTYADVSWKPPVHGNVKSYNIVYWSAHNPLAKRKTIVQYPAVKGSLVYLKQGTKYVVEVKSVAEWRESQCDERKTFYTVPSPPWIGNIDAALDSIKLKWSRKEDEPDVTEAVVTYCLPGSTQKITKHVSTAEPQQLLISPLNLNTRIAGYVELVCGDKTSDKTHWSATTDS